MKSSKKIILMLILTIFMSCNSNEEEVIIRGSWNVDNFLVNGEKKNKSILGLLFTFDNDYKCKIPVTTMDYSINSNKKAKGIWKLEKQKNKEFKLSIKTENKIINGDFLLRFWYNKELKIILMTLEKDSIFFLNYDPWNLYKPNDKFIQNNTFDFDEEMKEYIKKRMDKMKLKKSDINNAEN